jgi:hypothetical protein
VESTPLVGGFLSEIERLCMECSIAPLLQWPFYTATSSFREILCPQNIVSLAALLRRKIKDYKEEKVLNDHNAYLEGKGVIVNCCACFQARNRQSEEKEFPRF